MTDKVEVKGDCPERVAFDLAERIFYGEGGGNNSNYTAQDAREYWLTLMYECRHIVTGGLPEHIE
jgi:hypothetical protein